jgi:hypothetical protein
MPTPYIYGQTPLEKFAINGNPSYGNSGRLWLIQQSKVGTGKYPYAGPYKNPDITGNQGDKYSVTHTNAKADTVSPYLGKGTGNQIDVVDTYKGVTARINYAGGSLEDIKGNVTNGGLGREKQQLLNSTTWGYGTKVLNYKEYDKQPDMKANKGQVNII